MGDRRHRDHRNNGSQGSFTPADLEKALSQRQNMKIKVGYEHIHAPLAQPVSGSVVIGNVLKIFAVGGNDQVTQLAHDLFVEHCVPSIGKSALTPQECLAKSCEFYSAVGDHAMQMAAEAAAQELVREPEDGDGETGSGIVIP